MGESLAGINCRLGRLDTGRVSLSVVITVSKADRYYPRILAILAILAIATASAKRRSLGVRAAVLNGEERREALAEGVDGLGARGCPEGDC
jgi:hypothetical protein